MTAPIADRAAGVLQGAADAAAGTKHQVRAWSQRARAGRPRGRRPGPLARRPPRPEPVRERRLPRHRERRRAGMNRLARQGKQATAMEAAMTREAESKEAGSVSTGIEAREPATAAEAWAAIRTLSAGSSPGTRPARLSRPTWPGPAAPV